MESTSSTSQNPESSPLPHASSAFDVFINHRGPETKKTYASQLYRRLLSYGLQPFLDREELQQGDNITAQIQAVIRTATVHVALLSPRYADSTSCLEELVLMLQSGAPVVPVFLHVKPSEVRCRKGNDGVYGRALQHLENKITYDSQIGESKPRYESKTIETWRMALNQVSGLSGLDLEAFNGDEEELLDKVVEIVLKKVRPAKYPTASKSTSISSYSYDVFIHRSPDVKRTFASHLYHRLLFYGLRPFLESEKKQKGANMATKIETEEAIATASVHVAIFSPQYAESHRCLDELLLALESGAPVFSVFYNVKPLDLRSTKGKDGVYAGVCGPAFQHHEKKLRFESETTEMWRKALDDVLKRRVFELDAVKGDEAALLNEVIKSVLESVRKAPLYVVDNVKDLDGKVEDLENTVLLRRQSGKPQVVGIVGSAGVGKTTLAKELINRKSSSFIRTCFLNIRENVGCGLHSLQSKLFKDLTNLNIQLKNVSEGIELFTKHVLSFYGAAAFVILDDVDNVYQLEALLPVQNFLSSKSLILITSLSEDVLIQSGVEQSSIYNLSDNWLKLSLAKRPSGLNRKVKDIADKAFLLQDQQSEKPQVVGIVGVPGIGKTKLATEFFNRKSSDYRRSYFLYDVTENARTSLSLLNLHRKLLQGLTQLDLQVGSVDEYRDLFREHVSYFRSLVILDNVDHSDRLDALLSVLSVLPSGSLILITSRDTEVLKRSGVQELSMYELTGLNDEDSLELFCTHAFRQPSPFLGFEDLVAEFLKVCNGSPLTLKLFGALLCEKDISYWKEQLDKILQILPDQIEKRLELCYDELNEEEQQIFLHIACYCIGVKRDLAERLWDRSGSRGRVCFVSLQKKCLVDVDSEYGITMHELLRNLGTTIADKKGLRRAQTEKTDLLQK